MHIQDLLLPLLAMVLGVDSAYYKDCKCHNAYTSLQDNGVTKSACDKYAKDVVPGVVYSDTPHHQCSMKEGSAGNVIENEKWDQACKSFGEQYYQHCWNKD